MRFAVVLAASIVAVPAFAAGANDIASRWTIGAFTPGPEERVARIGDILWKQPLTSSALVTLAAPATTVKGKVLLPAGTELVAMDAGDRVIFCESTPRKASATEMLLIGSFGETASCLADSDGTGKFDGYFTKKVQYEGFPIIRGGLPDTAKPLQPLSYTVRPAGETVGAYWLGVRYVGGDRDIEAQRFEIVFGGKDEKASLTSAIIGPKGALPRTIEPLGSRVTILAVANGALRYRIEQPMPEQPFSVIRTFAR